MKTNFFWKLENVCEMIGSFLHFLRDNSWYDSLLTNIFEAVHFHIEDWIRIFYELFYFNLGRVDDVFNTCSDTIK